ncbi:hypothetical protein CH252_32950 [Rhodococcus sp. 06-1477-1B]|nr:hypothetical protein CH252_32950 [Rhodococcus sp. 06-1477-1B]
MQPDREPAVKVYARESLDQPLGPLIGEFPISGDIRLEHLRWALLAEDDADYLPNHVIERREWSSSWGASTEGIDFIVEVMNNPYVSGLITGLAASGVGATRRLLMRMRSAPITEEQAIHHAKQWIVLSTQATADDVRVVGSGVYPKGARWVDVETPTARYRVGVALTNSGLASVLTESWERLDG